VNRILALGNNVSPLIQAGAEGPAIVGDITSNLLTLNQDAIGIVNQLTALEQDAAKLFNLTAATQNKLRQQIREQVYLTTRKRFLEAFINDQQLDSSTASYDYGVGMASLPLASETFISPSKVEVGIASVGSLDASRVQHIGQRY